MLFERVLSACIKSVSLAVAALVLALGCGQAVTASAGEMTVSAAASLTNAFAELKTAFEKSHQGLTVHTNFAASNPLLKQMQEGAPVDVFASADQETMDKAQKAQLIKPESRKNFVSNTVVLIVPAQGKKFGSLAELKKAQRIAVGSPESVPVGRYTRDALKSAGLWETLQPSFIYGNSVRQVLDYVARGEVVCLTLTGHKPVTYPIAVATTGSNAAMGQAFVDFALSPEGQAILARYGFSKP
ncbi:molybdate ABC transporter substrate-binding protein [Desulfovibrio sp.]|uniref:molybdate ABC transporter substrate-binding protein n=1 Tax=Desulfovibrio sp. TaxID=885 RepID=UPI00307967B0